ncbi:hypothetical protein BDW66DRAFT_102110 [Aspergillus desertorum]
MRVYLPPGQLALHLVPSSWYSQAGFLGQANLQGSDPATLTQRLRIGPRTTLCLLAVYAASATPPRRAALLAALTMLPPPFCFLKTLETTLDRKAGKARLIGNRYLIPHVRINSINAVICVHHTGNVQQDVDLPFEVLLPPIDAPWLAQVKLLNFNLGLSRRALGAGKTSTSVDRGALLQEQLSSRQSDAG